MLRECTKLFHRFYKNNKNLLQILGERGSYIEGLNWRILPQQVLKITVLSRGVLLYFINGLSFV